MNYSLKNCLIQTQHYLQHTFLVLKNVRSSIHTNKRSVKKKVNKNYYFNFL